MRRPVSSLPNQATAILGPVVRHYVGCWVSYAAIPKELPELWSELEVGPATQNAIQVEWTMARLAEAIRTNDWRSA